MKDRILGFVMFLVIFAAPIYAGAAILHLLITGFPEHHEVQDCELNRYGHMDCR